MADSKPVDQVCMYGCTNQHDYDDECYWSCGLDSNCRWGSMMECVDTRPDKQLNCVVDYGCFDFVEKYLNGDKNVEKGPVLFDN